MTDSSTVSFSEKVETASALVDERLATFLSEQPQIANLHDAMKYSMGLDIEDRALRGKRLRPVLCVLTAEALGGTADAALPFACAIELMHNFALVHDDIEDGDEIRRDRPAVWKKFGTPHGINVGDYLLCQVYQVLLGAEQLSPPTRLALINLMTQTLDHTIIGQSYDITARGRREFAHEDYFNIVREKTGYYLAAPMLGGAIVAEADDQVISALQCFGLHMGPLFQITDDLLDLTVGKGRGGQLGSDIREGKRSFMVAEVAFKASDEDKALLFDLLDKEREATTDEDVDQVIALYQKYEAVEAANAYSEELKAKALEELKSIPEPLSTWLSEFAASMINRKR